MKTYFSKNLKALTLSIGFFSLVACSEKSILNPDLIPEVDNINTFEVTDFNLSVENKYFDSLVTSNYPVMAVGRISNDPFFGKSIAGAYMQFIPPTTGFKFPDNVIMDSMVLVVPYSGFTFGDTLATAPLHFRAYEITDPFSNADTNFNFYVFNKLNYNTTAIGSQNMTLQNLLDTVPLSNGDTVTRQLRLRFTNAFMNTFSQFDSSVFATNAAFLDKFKGVYLTVDSNAAQRSLAYFLLTNATVSNSLYGSAHIETFYRSSSADTVSQRTFFSFSTTSSAFFNNITRNYTGYPVSNFLSSTANRDSLIIQGYPGFKSEVTIPLQGKLIPSVINKASLTITVLPTQDAAIFNAAPQLTVAGINDDGTERPIADLSSNTGSSSSAFTFVDGTPKEVTINGTKYLQYTINMPREMQQQLSQGKSQVKLRIATSATYPGAFRLVGFGPNAADPMKLKLQVIYTKLK